MSKEVDYNITSYVQISICDVVYFQSLQSNYQQTVKSISEDHLAAAILLLTIDSAKNLPVRLFIILVIYTVYTYQTEMIHFWVNFLLFS